MCLGWMKKLLEYPIAVIIIILSVGAVFCSVFNDTQLRRRTITYGNNACTLKILGPWYFAVLDIHDLTCIHSPSRSNVVIFPFCAKCWTIIFMT